MLNVHYVRAGGDGAAAELRKALAEGIRLTVDEAGAVPADTDVLINGRPTRDQLAASPRLRTLIIPWAGVPDTVRELAPAFPHVQIHNLHHNAQPVAELTIALLLAAARFIVPLDQALRRGDWRPRYHPPPAMLLAGRTALILGYGAIGRRVAPVCRALGMTVLATRRRGPATVEEQVTLYPADALPQLLPQADALLICLPLTPATEGLIGAAELAALPEGAVLVNVGRGGIVVEEALYAALRDGRLRAAGLDVWYNYPADEDSRAATPPANYPFHELDNVVFSPHRGGSSDGTEPLRMAALAELLNAAAAGQPMPNRVDLGLGY